MELLDGVFGSCGQELRTFGLFGIIAKRLAAMALVEKAQWCEELQYFLNEMVLRDGCSCGWIFGIAVKVYGFSGSFKAREFRKLRFWKFTKWRWCWRKK